jgi:copper chaperone NosL
MTRHRLRRRATFALLALGVLGVVACRGKQSWPPSPVDLVLGEDVCETCKMTISDGHFGAQLQRSQGTGDVQRFDDVGCVLAAHAGEKVDLQGVFVRTLDGSAWVRGDSAWITRSTEIHSPMGYGFGAFASERAARAEAEKHADGHTWTLAALMQAKTPLASDEPKPAAVAGSQGEH